MSIAPRLGPRLSMLIRFSIVSLVGTGLDLGSFWLLNNRLGVTLLLATLFSAELSIVNSFVWNNLWTYRGHGGEVPLLRRFLSFNALYAGSLVVSLVTVEVLSLRFGPQHTFIYKLITLPANFIWNYLSSTYLVWRVRATQPHATTGAVEGTAQQSMPPYPHDKVS